MKEYIEYAKVIYHQYLCHGPVLAWVHVLLLSSVGWFLGIILYIQIFNYNYNRAVIRFDVYRAMDQGIFLGICKNKNDNL